MPEEGCALVTGGSRGIGAEIAVALAEDGWPVGINYRANEDAAKEVARRIESNGGQAALMQGDVADAESVEPTFQALEEQFGRVLVLVNNAGIRVDTLSPQMSDEEWQQVIDTNLTAPFRYTRRALKGMLRARFGRIVNISSIVGSKANPGQANYAASKAGLIGLTKTVAAEVGRRGITVNAVAPGLVESDMTEDVGEGLAGFVPARRLGQPKEIAECVRYLVSENAGYINGATITVDGGLTA
jgi:3-oxoacyl-[acyl-carrier protein] reductase